MKREGFRYLVDVLPLDVSSRSGYTHIFAPASNAGKNIIPRIAAGLDVTAITEIMSVDSEDMFTRPLYAGNAIARVKSDESIKVCVVLSLALCVNKGHTRLIYVSGVFF